MIPRCLHLSFTVPDGTAGQASLFYPADDSRTHEARLTGFVPPIATTAPFPAVIVVPGINITPASYRWLALRLVEAGFCAITYSTIGSLGPAGVGITPGIDLEALAPEVVGTRPSASALAPLLSAVGSLDGSVRDVVDLNRVALVGHSAGGTVALHNANPEWFPGLRAVAAYGAHTMTATALGHSEVSVASLASMIPIALVHGEHDGVIEASRDRYRSDDAEHDPIRATFSTGISSERGDSWLIGIAGGNHFTMCDPVDETSGRSFLEADLRSDDNDARDALARVLVGFLDDYVRREPSGPGLQSIVAGPEISRWDRR